MNKLIEKRKKVDEWLEKKIEMERNMIKEVFFKQRDWKYEKKIERGDKKDGSKEDFFFLTSSVALPG